MKQDLIYKLLIITFAILYVAVAGISFFHAIEFFSISNLRWMAVALAGAFEIGQATVLISLMLSEENRKKMLPWIVMIILTAVQVIGNVFSTYKFISLNDISNYYTYLQQPLLFWLQLEDPTIIKIIISWITGALLPIVALLLTAMVAMNLKFSVGEIKNDVKYVDSSNKEKDIIAKETLTSQKTNESSLLNNNVEDISANFEVPTKTKNLKRGSNLIHDDEYDKIINTTKSSEPNPSDISQRVNNNDSDYIDSQIINGKEFLKKIPDIKYVAKGD